MLRAIRRSLLAFAAVGLVAGCEGPRPPARVHVPAIQPVQINEAGVHGRLFLPQGEGAHPGLILIGGSEGGTALIEPVAASFAEQGYTVLALAYWREPGLPPRLENIPVEYFRGAFTWLAGRAEVDPARIGVLGWSRGSEAALLLASREPRVRAVTVVSPSNFLWASFVPGGWGKAAAWTEDGKPLPYLRPASMTPYADIRNPGAAAIPVEAIQAPILIVTGEADQVWPSSAMAGEIDDRLRRAGRPAPQRLTYPKAGHGVFVGDPDGEFAARAQAHPGKMGGTPEGNLAAWRDDWPKVLAFYKQALGG